MLSQCLIDDIDNHIILKIMYSKMISINEAPQVEPMRKRSSSATEATKPINDMQRKIVQTLSEFQLFSVWFI